MTGSIEVEIPDTLLTILNSKGGETPERLNFLGNEIAFRVQEHAVDEAPHLTGNLEASHRISQNGLFSWIVYPDEGVAPYALYVILGHLTRPSHVSTPMGKMRYGGGQHMVPGNPYLDRAVDASQGDIDAEIEKFEEWFKGD